MTKHATGFDYVPDGGAARVIGKGELFFAAAGLAHGHILAQTQGLENAGAECKWVWDSDPKKVEGFLARFPHAKRAESLAQILDDPEIKLVANASVPADRADFGIECMRAGKHVFVDKPPFTTLEQLERVKKTVRETGLKYMPYYAERVHNEAAEKADEIVKSGAIGDILQVLILAPHRLSKSSRPKWFFERERYGGILVDIGSHQFEQFLQFTGCESAEIVSARVANFGNPDTPQLQDFGEALLKTPTGASCYCRVDWFTPDGLPVWGDGRTFILGTKGYVEIRKYIDFSLGGNPPQVLYLADSGGVRQMRCLGNGFPFFGKFVLDILNGTENAMSQSHAFAAAELALRAQIFAEKNL